MNIIISFMDITLYINIYIYLHICTDVVCIIAARDIFIKQIGAAGCRRPRVVEQKSLALFFCAWKKKTFAAVNLSIGAIGDIFKPEVTTKEGQCNRDARSSKGKM